MQSGVKLGGGAAGTDDDTLYVQDAADYSVRPDSVTLGGYSTTPDAEYLKQMQDESSPNSDVDMDDSGSEMREFNVDLGINLGSMELAVTDYVTILLDENKVGFAVGLPWLVNEPNLSAASWGAIVLMGTVQVGAAYILMARGLATTGPVAANLVCMTEPVLNPVWVALFWGETVGPMSLLGIAVVLAGLLFYNLAGAKKREEAPGVK